MVSYWRTWDSTWTDFLVRLIWPSHAHHLNLHFDWTSTSHWFLLTFSVTSLELDNGLAFTFYTFIGRERERETERVGVCACVGACVLACVRACVCVCVCLRACARASVCVCVCVCARARVHACERACLCVVLVFWMVGMAKTTDSWLRSWGFES